MPPESTMPAIFVSHGAPTLILEESPARRFLAGLGERLPRPTAIVAVSAHWCTQAPAVSSATRPETVHDFYGFPEPLYRLRYPAPGAPDLAARIETLLGDAGIAVERDPDQGLDHGGWVPAMLGWPEADIPILQLAVQPGRDAAHHYRQGLALAPLRAEGVLVLGSGGAVHNLRALDRTPGAEPAPWAQAFDDWLCDAVTKGAVEDLVGWTDRAPAARMNHPTVEHFVPLFVALGAAGERPRGEVLHRGFMAGSLSMSAFAFH